MIEKDINILFGVYYKEYFVYIKNYCYMKLGDYPDFAEDCIQDTFRVLFEKLSNNVEFEYVKAFLIKTASNFVKLKYREIVKERNKNVSLDTEDIEIPYEEDLLDNVSDDTIERLKNEILYSLTFDEQRLLRSTCKDYKDEYRTVKQLALEYDCSERAIRQRIFVLRKKVRELVKDKLKNL